MGVSVIIDSFVEGLDIEEYGFSYYKLNKSGRAPFRLTTMLNHYISGYKNEE